MRLLAIATAVTMILLPQGAGAATTTDSNRSPECTIEPIKPDAEPEWTTIAGSTFGQLVGTGGFDIKSAYRITICERDFTVYLLQGIVDRSEVYECPVDDTYRPVQACNKLTVPSGQ